VSDHTAIDKHLLYLNQMEYFYNLVIGFHLSVQPLAAVLTGPRRPWGRSG